MTKYVFYYSSRIGIKPEPYTFYSEWRLKTCHPMNCYLSLMKWAQNSRLKVFKFAYRFHVSDIQVHDHFSSDVNDRLRQKINCTTDHLRSTDLEYSSNFTANENEVRRNNCPFWVSELANDQAKREVQGPVHHICTYYIRLRYLSNRTSNS